ncbi:hypothetical protein BDR03DRAFT_938468 [Suillus americanus]|nr:hypothetical protein BDR03DRAFT_938468 [Suillus americanus]
MMAVSILRRGATNKVPETSPASRVCNRGMMISIVSCISDDGRCSGGGNGSMRL